MSKRSTLPDNPLTRIDPELAFWGVIKQDEQETKQVSKGGKMPSKQEILLPSKEESKKSLIQEKKITRNQESKDSSIQEIKKARKEDILDSLIQEKKMERNQESKTAGEEERKISSNQENLIARNQESNNSSIQEIKKARKEDILDSLIQEKKMERNQENEITVPGGKEEKPAAQKVAQKVKVNYVLDERDIAAVKHFAVVNKKNISEVITEAIRRYVPQRYYEVN